MKRPVRRLLIAVAVLFTLALIAVLALPALVDVNRYRGTIEAKAEEALGRDVRLGEMRLSVLPLGVTVQEIAIGALEEEGGGDLLTARSLRVGARLGALLQKRLEVTSLVLEGPELTLERGPDGNWNVQRLVAASGECAPPETVAPPAASGPGAAFSVDRLRIKDGRITVRVASAAGLAPLQATLVDLDLRLDDLALDREVSLRLSTALESHEGARLRLDGSAGPLASPGGAPVRLAGNLVLENLPPDVVRNWAKALVGEMPATGILGERPFSAAIDLTASYETFEDRPPAVGVDLDWIFSWVLT